MPQRKPSIPSKLKHARSGLMPSERSGRTGSGWDGVYFKRVLHFVFVTKAVLSSTFSSPYSALHSE